MLQVPAGTTSKLIRIFIQDTSKSDGSGLTGLVYNSVGLTAYYVREGASAATAITLATMVVGTWATGGFKEVDAANLPGVYEVGIPDAALATGASTVVVYFKGAANMAPTIKEIQLDSARNNSVYPLKALKWSISGTTLTVYKEDGTTVDFTRSVTTGSATPITGIG